MILHIARVILIVFEVLALFNLLIIVHELGHFLAARWRGLYIEKFGVWFGKPIWKKTINGVEYSLGSLPFGGFVALPQLAPMDIIEGKADVDRAQLPKISAFDKIIVAFAGPLFSFLLAVVFAVFIWMVGRPVSESEATTIIGYVVPASPAAQAGLKAGDKILSVDGHGVTRFGGMSEDSITWRIVRSEGETIPITVERNEDGKRRLITVEAKPIIPQTHAWWKRKGLRQIEIAPAETPLAARVLPDSPAAKAGIQANDLIVGINGKPLYHINEIDDFLRENPSTPIQLSLKRNGADMMVPFEPGPLVVGEVLKDSPAARMGLQKGDAILAIDQIPMKSTAAASDYIRQHGDQPVVFSVQRALNKFDLKITPEVPQGEQSPRVGISWEDYGIVLDTYGRLTRTHPTPLEQIRAATLAVVNTLGAIASPKSDVRLQHMSGPVMMLRVYYLMFENRDGWLMALWFSVILNVNLAILNLIPMPVLDGGHIALALVEALRRRPVNARVLEIVQTACAVVIIGFMVYIAFFDVQDLFGRAGPKFVPKDSSSSAR
jgi:regulator of sigma E protease